MKMIISTLAMFLVLGLHPSISAPSCPTGQTYNSELGSCVSNTSSSNNNSANNANTCAQGQHWDSKHKKCVTCKSSEKWDDKKGKCVKK